VVTLVWLYVGLIESWIQAELLVTYATELNLLRTF
jgi:hypothetical protein